MQLSKETTCLNFKIDLWKINTCINLLQLQIYSQNDSNNYNIWCKT
jgi:hypothetical protein